MARIRSLHPGQWRDENFVECSFGARLLALALRNEADDQGVFEWKPKQIKMNCFPGDSVDIDTMLSELVVNRIICRFEVEGRILGAIRNFRLYQRPKKPNAIYPVTEEIREYVALSGNKFGTSGEFDDDEVETSSPPVGKSVQQMEEGGDKMKEEGGIKTSGAAPPAPPVLASPFIEIPTNRFETTGEQFPVYEPMIEEYQQLYQAVDVRAELRKMRGWALAKDKKRKTLRGMKTFINAWLAKEQDAAPRETFGGRNGRHAGRQSAVEVELQGIALELDRHVGTDGRSAPAHDCDARSPLAIGDGTGIEGPDPSAAAGPSWPDAAGVGEPLRSSGADLAGSGDGRGPSLAPLPDFLRRPPGYSWACDSRGLAALSNGAEPGAEIPAAVLPDRSHV